MQPLQVSPLIQFAEIPRWLIEGMIILYIIAFGLLGIEVIIIKIITKKGWIEIINEILSI